MRTLCGLYGGLEGSSGDLCEDSLGGLSMRTLHEDSPDLCGLSTGDLQTLQGSVRILRGLSLRRGFGGRASKWSGAVEVVILAPVAVVSHEQRAAPLGQECAEMGSRGRIISWIVLRILEALVSAEGTGRRLIWRVV